MCIANIVILRVLNTKYNLPIGEKEVFLRQFLNIILKNVDECYAYLLSNT